MIMKRHIFDNDVQQSCSKIKRADNYQYACQIFRSSGCDIVLQQNIGAAICFDQLYRTLTMHVINWVQDKDLETLQKAREIPDEYVQIEHASNATQTHSHSRPFVSQKTL